jgi:putative ABC transport system permease protein
MLGIIIGIASVIMITSIGSGFQATVNGAFEEMGLNGIQIFPNRGVSLVASDMLTMADEALLKQHPEAASVAPFWQSRGSVKLKNPKETESFYLIGTTDAYKTIQPVNLSYGRFIADADVQKKARVAIIDERLAVKIFGRKDATGGKFQTTFWFGTVEYTVIGIVKLDAMSALFSTTPVIYVPITQALAMYSTKNVDSLYITVKNTDTIEQTAIELNRLLETSHRNTGKYRIENVMQQMEAINTVFSSVTAFVSFVAAISLLLGGIGVMNIMLVTVTERTREIGIRKALGATDGNISFQFLVEAVILTAAGGIIGIAAGYAGSVSVGNLIRLKANLSVPMVILTVCLSSLIGIVFGVYPARKAAKLDPIDALRYE